MPGARLPDPGKRLFIVQHPDGREQEVVVEIEIAAVGLVERATGRRLEVENAFWTWPAERALNDHLWNEGKIPPGGRLTVAHVNPDGLQVAARWEGD